MPLAPTPRCPGCPPAGPRRSTRRRIRAVAWLSAICLSGLLPSPSTAHERSVSYSSWEIGPEATLVRLRVRLLELSRLGPQALASDLPGAPGADIASPDATNPLAARIADRLELVTQGRRCRPSDVRRTPDQPGWVSVRWRFDCPTRPGALGIRTRFLLDVAPSHLHFARVQYADDPDQVMERVLTEASPAWTLRPDGPADGAGSPASSAGSSLADYVALGIDHIVTGWDHLAFVFGLLLLATRLGEVARLITGFTIAHSLTLALAVMGVVHPRAAAVEALIAFSVALVAIEKGWLLAERHRIVPLTVVTGIASLALVRMVGWTTLPLITIIGLLAFAGCYFALAVRSRSEWLRFCLTFAFGLVHGLGFAGALAEMTLPADRLVPALVGFNVGVELGQIAVIALLWPLLGLLSRLAPHRSRRLASELSAAALCGLGLYWFALRAFSL